MAAWLRKVGPSLPPLNVLMGSAQVWRDLPATPAGAAPYGVGWAMCAFMMSTPTGKQLLREILAKPRNLPSGVVAIAERRWPGGIEQMDRDWRAWWANGISPLQLPVANDVAQGSGQQAAGWIRCKNGNLISEASGLVCGQWVADDNGVMTLFPTIHDMSLAIFLRADEV